MLVPYTEYFALRMQPVSDEGLLLVSIIARIVQRGAGVSAFRNLRLKGKAVLVPTLISQSFVPPRPLGHFSEIPRESARTHCQKQVSQSNRSTTG